MSFIVCGKTAAVALCATASIAILTGVVSAQGVGQRKAVGIEEIVVTANAGSLTAVTVSQARDRLERVPGGIGFVEADVFADDFAQSIGDALQFTPGVFADTSAQRETRISIRGSGLNSSFERRGLTVLRNGVPITRASGSTEFQEVDPLSVRYIEVFKGANGLRYGAASLGGAVNLVTPTGRTVESPFSARIEGGSFSTLRANASYGGTFEGGDVYVGVTGLRSNGFREHSDVRSVYGFSNLGLKLSETVETRFYLTALSDNFELAGSLSLEDALENREQAARPVTAGPFFPGGPVTVLDPGPVADDWDRNLDVVRIANRTVAALEAVTLEGGFWYARRNLDHAITRFAGIIVQEEDEVGLYGRVTGDMTVGSLPVDWTIGFEANESTNEAQRFANDSGARGELRTESDQDASNILAYAQAELGLTDSLTAVTGLQWLRAVRDNDAILNDVPGRVVSRQLNPRFGLLYDLNDSAQIFANVNRGFEPATLSDLTAGGALDFTPLDAQQAWTVEIGTRGQADFIAWDVSLYRSWVDNELLDFGAPGSFGFVSFTDNADNTIHQGVEVGIDLFIADKTLSEAGYSLVWRNIYTLNDFRFEDDPTFADNTLAGVPRHVYISELKLDADDGWYVSANLRWIPDGPYVDFANTTQVPGYELVGFTAGVDLTDTLRLFGSVENIFDTDFISNVTTNANQELENGRVFTPGQGRAFFAGITASF